MLSVGAERGGLGYNTCYVLRGVWDVGRDYISLFVFQEVRDETGH